jgi:hypothetical protein
MASSSLDQFSGGDLVAALFGLDHRDRRSVAGGNLYMGMPEVIVTVCWEMN